MKVLLIGGGLFIAGSLLIPWISLPRLSRMQDEIDSLKADLEALRGGTAHIKPYETPFEAVAPAPEGAVALEEDVILVPRVTVPEPTIDEDNLLPEISYVPKPISASAAAPAIKREEGVFERNIATRLTVWIGAVSLIFAAFFLVKYSIEAGLFGPLPRLIMGGAFGLALVGAAQWLVGRPQIANYKRMAQGFAGAGLVILYVSLYAGVSLYGFLPPIFGFTGMTIVTVMAVILSLRHGQPIAVFALLGGMLTPALVSSDSPNVATLFIYLFILSSGLLAFMARNGWWLLAAITLGAVFSWTGFWYLTAFQPEDAFVLVLFGVAICVVVGTLTAKYMSAENADGAKAMPVHVLNFLSLGGATLTILILGFKVTLSLFDWSMLGIVTLGCMALAYMRPHIYRNALAAKLGADLLLLCIWIYLAEDMNALIVYAAFVTIYVLLPAFIMRKVTDPRFWAVGQIVSAIALYFIGYKQNFVADNIGGAVALLLASVSVLQAAEIRIKYQADAFIQNYLVSVYAFAATVFISSGLVIMLPYQDLPLAFAAQVLATIWVYGRTGIAFLKSISFVLTLAFFACNIGQLLLFAQLGLSSLSHARIPYSIASFALLSPTIGLLLPALFTGLAAYTHARQSAADTRLSNTLLSVSLLLVLASGYYIIRGVMFGDGSNVFLTHAGFIERGIVTAFIGAVGVAVAEKNKQGLVLVVLALLRVVYFDVLLLNPLYDSAAFVGGLPIINAITLTYGLGVGLAAYLAKRATEPSLAIFGKVAAFGLLFALVSLNVRQLFHGSQLGDDVMGDAENYSYSIAWLVTGAVLLGLGLIRRSKVCRAASLVFLLLTVGKVFLFDASALTGLYRVFSFFGLGVSLIGLSFFYSRFIFSSKNRQSE